MDNRDREIEARLFAVALCRADEHPGGMDWVKKAGKMIQARDARIRAEAWAEAASKARSAILGFGNPQAAADRYSPMIRKDLAVQLVERAILADEPKFEEHELYVYDDAKPLPKE